MHARVTRLRILPGKTAEFIGAIEALMPTARKQAGFRGAVVMRAGDETVVEATLISVWNSLAELRGSESNMYYYDALARLFAYCEGYPIMHEEEVLSLEFNPQ